MSATQQLKTLRTLEASVAAVDLEIDTLKSELKAKRDWRERLIAEMRVEIRGEAKLFDVANESIESLVDRGLRKMIVPKLTTGGLRTVGALLEIFETDDTDAPEPTAALRDTFGLTQAQAENVAEVVLKLVAQETAS